MSKKDLTQLSKKELESMLAKKYGVDKYLNQRSQLLGLLGSKGETNIESGFTGPETEALSIMFGNSPAIGSRSKAEGGIVNLYAGSEDEESESMDQDEDAGMGTDFSGGGFDEADDEDESRAGDYQTTSGGDDNESTVFSGLRGPEVMKEIESNPQLKGFLGNKMKSLVKEGKISNLERDDRGRLTGMTSEGNLPGVLGGIASLMGIGTGSVYTGYGKGFSDALGGGDDGSDSSEMIKKIVAEKPHPEIS